jgi:MoaA/NifB/PqqE/SkfB family radical SAM enzyme
LSSSIATFAVLPYEYLERAKLHHTPAKANTEMLKAIRMGTQLGVRVRPFPPIAADDALEAAWHAAVVENFSFPTRMDWYFQQARYLAEHPSNNADHRCYLPWSECFFGVDGTVAPCDLYLRETTIGNLYDDDFWSIWNGSSISTMRRTVNNKPLGLCQHGTCIFRPASGRDSLGIEPCRD